MPFFRIAVASIVLATSSRAYADADCDSSDRSAARLVVDLGHLKVHDAGNNTDYSFAICETYNVFERTGRLAVVGSPITSTYVEAAEADKLAAQSPTECIQRGAPYTPTGPTDQRLVEYRLCQRGGKPSRMDVVVRAVDQSGKAKPVQTLSVPFPNLRAQPAKYLPFVAASSSDRTVSCEDDERNLGTVDAQDDANLTHYRFAACLKKDGLVYARSNFLTATYWTPQQVAAQAATRSCIPNGAPYSSQGPGDERAVTYRLCGHGGGPATVEIEVTALDAQWKKKPAKKLSAPVK